MDAACYGVMIEGRKLVKVVLALN